MTFNPSTNDKSIKKLTILQVVLAGLSILSSSCITIQPRDITEKWCFYDSAGIYHCKTCSNNTCFCSVSAYDLCTFNTWERACRACYENRYTDYSDLYFDNRLNECSPMTVCALCKKGAEICGPYPRPYWVHPKHQPYYYNTNKNKQKKTSRPSESHRRLMDNRIVR